MKTWQRDRVKLITERPNDALRKPCINQLLSDCVRCAEQNWITFAIIKL